MELTNLNYNSFSAFGKLLKTRPNGKEVIEENYFLLPADEIEVYRCAHPVTVDYAEGMTALVIYNESSPIYFYLDCIAQINPGVLFSFLPLEEFATVVVLHSQDDAIETVGKNPTIRASDDISKFALEKIYTVFYQETSSNFYFRGESHSAYELVYVDRGSLHNILNGHDYVVSQQECIIVDQNQWHMQYSDLPVSFLTVSFSHTGNLSQALTGKIMSVPAAIRPVLSKILEERNDNPFYTEYIAALVQIFLIDLIRNLDIRSLSAKTPATLFSENLLVDKALKLISENLSQKISLNDLANELHISIPYLYKLFNEHLNMPPGQYIMKIRLEESKMLLREGKMNIGSIARECGFASIQHYSRQFRQHFLISPSEYIKSLR